MVFLREDGADEAADEQVVPCGDEHGRKNGECEGQDKWGLQSIELDGVSFVFSQQR